MKIELLKGWGMRPKGTQMDVAKSQADLMIQNRIAKAVEEQPKPQRGPRIGRSFHQI